MARCFNRWLLMQSSNSDSGITPEQIIQAYRHGYFPMATSLDGDIDWFIAEPRTIIPLDERFRVRRSLRQALRKTDYEIRINTSFDEVIRACSRHDVKDEDGVWLSEEMIGLYRQLYRRGFAHSVEVWTANELSGGLYGIAIQGAFFGESMFTRKSNASQIALVALVERLRERGYKLLDAQMRTPHISYFGAIDLSHIEYLNVLAKAMSYDCSFI
jgi:leucyl/phenylalanyl-tRNA---protein transferase